MDNWLQEDDEIKISQRRINDFCEKYHFPRMKVKSVLIQENIRLLHAVILPVLKNEFFQDPLVFGYSDAPLGVKDIIRKQLCLAYEQQYRQNICHIDYKLIYQNGQYQLYIVTVFEKPIFYKASTNVQNLEDHHVGLLAKKLRYLTGRGPKNTKAIWMNPSLIVYIIHGLMSVGDGIFASKSLHNANWVEKIAEHNLKEAFGSIYTGSAINSLNIIDINNNVSISFVSEIGNSALHNIGKVVSNFVRKPAESITMFCSMLTLMSYVG